MKRCWNARVERCPAARRSGRCAVLEAPVLALAPRRPPERRRPRRGRGSRPRPRAARASVRDQSASPSARPPASRARAAGGEQRHRRTAVADNDDARRLVGEALAHDELVGSRAADRRADAFQSIASTSSPGRYGREPATSEPGPRRALRIAPNARPISRRRGASGNVTPRACHLRRGGRRARRPRRRGSATGRGAARSSASRKPSAAAAQPIRRASARKRGAKTMRCTSTGTNRRSTSSGTT